MANLFARLFAALKTQDATTCPASIDGGNRTCGNTFDRDAARAENHAGFCSHACAIEDLDNSPM